MKALVRGCLVGVVIAASPLSVFGQESKSSTLVKQLLAALQSAKLDTIAAKDPAAADRYVGALHIAGSQLLVVSGSYTQPALLDARIAKKEYRDVYIDLNSASVPASRLLIEDLGADGLRAKRQENDPFDSVDSNGKRTMFDGDWKAQKLSEEEYMKAFGTADERYSQMLMSLIAQLQKGT
jgi:hypothetical protein